MCLPGMCNYIPAGGGPGRDDKAGHNGASSAIPDLNAAALMPGGQDPVDQLLYHRGRCGQGLRDMVAGWGLHLAAAIPHGHHGHGIDSTCKHPSLSACSACATWRHVREDHAEVACLPSPMITSPACSSSQLHVWVMRASLSGRNHQMHPAGLPHAACSSKASTCGAECPVPSHAGMPVGHVTYTEPYLAQEALVCCPSACHREPTP